MIDAKAFLANFNDVTGGKDGQYQCRCPAHKDNRASLSIKVNCEKVALNCKAGCKVEAVVEAAGLKMTDLFSKNGSPKKQKSQTVCEYDYRDEAAKLLFQVVRKSDKTFPQRRWLGGKWVWKLGDVRRVLYRTEKLSKLPEGSSIIVAEGEKDVHTLERMGFHATCSSGGAGNWLPEHAEQLRGHNVAIVRDNDDPGLKHALEVADSLVGIASRVRLVKELPGLQHKGDVTDWDEAGGTREKLIALIQETPDHKRSEEQPAKSTSTEDMGIVHTLASIVMDCDKFAQDDGERLYRYSDGVYKRRATQFVSKRVRKLCEDLGKTKLWKRTLGGDVAEYIRLQSPNLWERPHETIVNVQNGLLDIASKKLTPHSPEHLSSIQLPIEFDPKATCPATDKFDSQVFPQDAIILSHEIAAVLLHPGLRIQKAILFLGEGGAGKSRKLNQYKKFIGSSLCSAVSLHDLESNKFAPARLFGKLANICADLPSAHLAGISIFKAITGGDTITAEDKFKTSFEFDCYAKLIFSANHPPRSQDASQALFDRWVVVPFQGRFRGTSEEIPQDELDALLTSPSELSGLLNHALACIDRLRRTARYSEPESVREAHREFHEATDPLAVWLNRFTVDDPEAKVPMGVLRSAYGAECEQHGRPALTKTAFGTQLKQLRPDIEDRKRTVNGRSQWCYVGLGFAADDEFSSKEVEPDNSPDTRPTGVTGVAPLVTTFYHASEDETTEGSKEAEGKSDNKWAESGNSGQSGNGNESSPSLAASDNGHCQCGRPWTPTVAPDGRKFNQCVPCDLIFPVREVEVQTSDFD